MEDVLCFMNKGHEGRLRSALFTLILNIYFLISIPVCWSTFKWDMKQGLYFVFGTFFLFAASLLCPPKRRLKNVWLGLFVITSLTSVFLHNFYYTPTTLNFINFSLMCEGFVFVLCGVLLYKLIFEYGLKDLRFYPGLWIALGIWVLRKFYFPNFAVSIWSILGAIAVGVLIYLFQKERYFLFFLAGFSAILTAHKYWYWIWLKLDTRLCAWAETLKLIILNPLGTGFENSINANTVFVIPPSTALGQYGGRTFINNDILSITKDLGIIATFVLIMLLLHLFRNIKIDKLVIICLMILAYSCVKSTWYYTRNAMLFIPLFALMEARKYEV